MTLRIALPCHSFRVSPWKSSGSHRSMRVSFPRHARRMRQIVISHQYPVSRIQTLHFSPEVRSQIVELLAEALVSDYKAYAIPK